MLAKFIQNSPFADTASREVERSHAREHPERLLDDLGGDVGGNEFEVVALHQRGGGAGRFHDFNDAAHFAARFGNMLGLIYGDAVGQCFRVAHHAFVDFVQIGHSPGDGHKPPALVRFGGRGDGGFRRGRARASSTC